MFSGTPLGKPSSFLSRFGSSMHVRMKFFDNEPGLGGSSVSSAGGEARIESETRTERAGQACAGVE
eukprot:4056332-Pyramimonas_sp.AAC.1